VFLQNGKFFNIMLMVLLCIGFMNGKLLPSKTLSVKEVHLVRCLTYISHRYFTPGRSLVISSPSAYRDVQQELIAEIHRTAIWPVVVAVDGDMNKPVKTDFINSDGSYIILIPDGNIKSLMAVINRLALGGGNTFTRIRNSESRFVVAGANEFSMLQLRDILDYFSKFRIYNCIIVSQEHYVLDKEYSRPINVNDVDTYMKLGVYTWFPYQSPDRCTDVNDITLLDSWVISAQGHFTRNTDLFQRKISNSLNGCPMKAVVRDGHWVFTTQYVQRINSNGNVVMYIIGLEYELLKVVLQQMNMTFVHVPTQEGSAMSYLVSGMIGKKIDIALGNMGMNYLSVPYFDSTNPYYRMTVRWYVPCSDKYPRWSSIYKILSVELWVVLIVSTVTAAVSTTLLARYSCTSEWQGYKTVSGSLTKVWSVIVRVRVPTKPRTQSLRSLFLAWVCFSFAFSTVFQVFLTKFLTKSGYKTPIQNMDELFNSGIKLAYQPEYNFISVMGPRAVSMKQANDVNCPSFEVCLNWAKYYKNVSVLLADIVAEQRYTVGDFLGENAEPLLCRLEDGVVFTSALSMIMSHGDPLMSRVSAIIDRVVEAGLYNYWVSTLINARQMLSRKIALAHPLDEYYSFNLYHMQPAFCLLLMGWCLSAICFIVESLFNLVLNKM
jgi:hypothetical protein